jgi:hypothetical protein
MPVWLTRDGYSVSFEPQRQKGEMAASEMISSIYLFLFIFLSLCPPSVCKLISFCPTHDNLLPSHLNQVNTPTLSLDDRFVFMPWNVGYGGDVFLLSFDANTYQLLSNSSANIPGEKKFDFGTSLVFVDTPPSANPACDHVFMINSLPHGEHPNGQAELMAFERTDSGIGPIIWPERLDLADFTGFSPPGSSVHINSLNQLTVFFNQPVEYTPDKTDGDKNNANYIGFEII